MRRVVLLAALAVPVAAQAQQEEPVVVYRQVTQLQEDDFRELPVNAEVVKPGGVYITGRDSAKFPPMFNLRANFTDMLAESVDQVK